MTNFPDGWPNTKQGKPMTGAQIRRSIVTQKDYFEQLERRVMAGEGIGTPLIEMSDEELLSLYQQYRKEKALVKATHIADEKVYDDDRPTKTVCGRKVPSSQIAYQADATCKACHAYAIRV